MSDNAKAEAIGYAIGQLIFKGILVWSCWGIPAPYFAPAMLALWLLDNVENHLRRLRKGE